MLVERTMRFDDGYVYREIIKLPPFICLDGPTARMRQLGYCVNDRIQISYRRIA